MEHISGIIDGKITAVTKDPLGSSASTSWSGFLLEEYGADVIRNDASWGYHKTHVCLVTAGSIRFRIQQDGNNEYAGGDAGSIFVFPSGMEEVRFGYDDARYQAICVEIEADKIPHSFPRHFLTRASIVPQLGFKDAQIAAILKSMRDEIAKDCPAGRLYGESLSLALGSYIDGRFGTQGCQSRIKSGFGIYHSRLLSEYIYDNIGSDFQVEVLASLVHTSPRQFFRLFRLTFGCSPHQYILRARITKARAMLSNGGEVIEVANALGFSSQSHFTEVFRRLTGTTPGRFRTECRA